jgi:small subunit ribosomal protein S3
LGQKIHPLGFRLVTTQKHRSIWFADFDNYSKFLNEDTNIRSFLAKKSKDNAISKVEIKRNSDCNKIEITIHTAKPGLFIGNSATELTNIYNNLKTQISSNRNLIINILEIKIPDSQAELIGDVIVALLEKRIAFRKAVKKGIARAQSVNVLGIKVQVAGRLNGAEMARTEWIREGRVPLQTLRADIDYAEKRANTIYGVLGIKVWLFNGEII